MERKSNIPDNLTCALITIDTGTRVLLTHYVKMTPDLVNTAKMWFIEITLPGSGSMYSKTITANDQENRDLTFDTLLKERTSRLRKHETRIMAFKDLPKDCQEELRAWEVHHKMNFDVVEWHVSFGHGSIYFE